MAVPSVGWLMVRALAPQVPMARLARGLLSELRPLFQRTERVLPLWYLHAVAGRCVALLEEHGVEVEAGDVSTVAFLLREGLIRAHSPAAPCTQEPESIRLFLTLLGGGEAPALSGADTGRAHTDTDDVTRRCEYLRRAVRRGRPFRASDIAEKLGISEEEARRKLHRPLSDQEMATLLGLSLPQLRLFLTPDPPVTVLNAVARATGYLDPRLLYVDPALLYEEECAEFDGATGAHGPCDERSQAISVPEEKWRTAYAKLRRSDGIRDSRGLPPHLGDEGAEQ
jgi:hypothetical protein